jgi:hypothetical protein
MDPSTLKRTSEPPLTPEPPGSEAALSATTSAVSLRARALRNNVIVLAITPNSNALNRAPAVLHYLDYIYAPPLSCLLDFLSMSTLTINSTRQRFHYSEQRNPTFFFIRIVVHIRQSYT